MSIAAVQWVYTQAPAHGASARAVALALAWDHTPEEGAFPSRERLAAATQLKERAIGNALRALEAEGSIRRAGYRPGGGTVVYRFPAIDGPAPDAEPTAAGGPARDAEPPGPAPDAVPHDVPAGPARGATDRTNDRNGKGSGDAEGHPLDSRSGSNVAREPIGTLF